MEVETLYRKLQIFLRKEILSDWVLDVDWRLNLITIQWIVGDTKTISLNYPENPQYPLHSEHLACARNDIDGSTLHLNTSSNGDPFPEIDKMEMGQSLRNGIHPLTVSSNQDIKPSFEIGTVSTDDNNYNDASLDDEHITSVGDFDGNGFSNSMIDNKDDNDDIGIDQASRRFEGDEDESANLKNERRKVAPHKRIIQKRLIKARKERETFSCSDCSVKFSGRKLLQRHLKLKHPGKESNQTHYPHGTCTICRKVIAIAGEVKSVKNSLLLHYEEFHKERLITCEVVDCSRKFVSPTEAKWHHRKDHLQERILCPHCPKTFRNEGRFNFHMDNIHGSQGDGENRFRCDQCDNVYRSAKGLKAHEDRDHSQSKKKRPQSSWRCHVCGYRVGDEEGDQGAIEAKSRTRLGLLLRHYEENHEDKIVVCKHQNCDRRFPKEFLMRSHFKKAHLQAAAAKEVFNCEFCDASYAAKASLGRHMDEHHIEHVKEPLSFLCQFLDCHRKFSTASNLDYHVSMCHTEREKAECHICSKTMLVKSLPNHIENHKNDGKIRLRRLPDEERKEDVTIPKICHLCGTSFSLAKSLKSHMKRRHPKPDQIKSCPQCGKSFTEESMLKLHIDGVHKNVRHQCNQCEKSYFTRWDMIFHQRAAHQGITVPCNYCSKAFARNSDRNRHEKTCASKRTIEEVENGVSCAS